MAREDRLFDEVTRELDEPLKTTLRGNLETEYEIYLAYTDDKFPLSFDEWLNT